MITQLEILSLAMRMHVLKILKSHKIHWHIIVGYELKFKTLHTLF
jgi:hypothetical protein